MIVEGTLQDGRQVMRTHGGIQIETIEQRDARIADEARLRAERAGPELLKASKNLLEVLAERDLVVIAAHLDVTTAIDLLRVAVRKVEDGR